jgi:hypothetical protein
MEFIEIGYTLRTWPRIKYHGNQHSDDMWEKDLIIVNDHYYQILVWETDDKILIKPIPDTDETRCASCNNDVYGYHQYEYQRLFRFTCHCENFDDSKIIDITDSI